MKSVLKLWASLVVMGIFVSTHTAFAQQTTSGSSGGLTNPLKAETITELLFGILDILLIFAVPIIVFFILYAGFKFVTAQGDTGKLQEARSAFTWAVAGGVIVLGAKLIMEVIKNTINAI